MIKSIGNLLATLAIVGMAMPVQAAETVETVAPRTIQDVQLTKDNLLLGAVVNATGQPEANAMVQIIHGKQVIATIKTDAKGRYAVRGLRAGVHTVKTAKSQSACRFWTASTAPPAAKKALVSASNDFVVRGQSGGGIAGVVLPLAAFGAVAAVTIVSTTQDDEQTISTPPASP